MLRALSAPLMVLALSEELRFLRFLVSSKLPSTRLPDSLFPAKELSKPACFTQLQPGIPTAANGDAQKRSVSNHLSR